MSPGSRWSSNKAPGANSLRRHTSWLSLHLAYPKVRIPCQSYKARILLTRARPNVIRVTKRTWGLSREAWIGIGVAVFIAVAGAGSTSPWWWPSSGDGTPQSEISGMSGGCPAFQVFAQNRWDPVGTAIRSGPNVQSHQVGSFPANMSISVNGWVHGRPAYPTNTAPWNNDIWFHLSDGAGWVSFPGVRATPVANDPTGTSPDGGTPAPTASSCEGAIQ
jgi:hypothetical protein